MINDLIFGGSYKDEQLQIEAMLVNPTTHGHADNMLKFEIRITTYKKADLESYEWDFYIMSGQNHIYNAVNITELPSHNETTMTVLVTYHFQTEFLYNNIRLGFLYEPYERIEFVEISH